MCYEEQTSTRNDIKLSTAAMLENCRVVNGSINTTAFFAQRTEEDMFVFYGPTHKFETHVLLFSFGCLETVVTPAKRKPNKLTINVKTVSKMLHSRVVNKVSLAEHSEGQATF